MVATATMTQTISPQNKLRTYIVLTKSSRTRLASFTDLLEESSPTNSNGNYTSPMKTLKKSLSASSQHQQAPAAIPDELLAYESYAAVASRFQSNAASSYAATASATSPTRDLRWSDISRPRLHIATMLKNGKPLSQKARKRQLRRNRSASGNPNDHLEVHALELCFEFLDLADLQRATVACTDFRDLIQGSSRLLVGLYARKWRAEELMARAYYALSFQPLLGMYQQRPADFDYPVATRSHVTKRQDATYEILNNSLLRTLRNGAVDSVRGTTPLPVLSCAQALGQRVSYYEVTMKGCGSMGVVSLSDAATRSAYGYGSDEHVGWKGVAFGYHGNDGDFVYNDGTAPYGGLWKPYGPSWGGNNTQDDAEAATFTVGCGLNLVTHQLFFTLNGTFLGYAPIAVPEGEYAAAVSLHEFKDQAVMNAGSAPFRFDIEGFCASP